MYIVSRFKFSSSKYHEPFCDCKITLDSPLESVIICSTLDVWDDHLQKFENFTEKDHILGQKAVLKNYNSLREVADVSVDYLHVSFRHFPCSSVTVFTTKPIRSDLSALQNKIEKAVSGLSLVDINFVLFSCEQEERDRTGGERGAYDLPGHGKMVYCGLTGRPLLFYTLLECGFEDSLFFHIFSTRFECRFSSYTLV